MAVTLKQIAKTVGADVSTVSRVLHNPRAAKVSPRTRRRIEETAHTLGYQVHAGAQALVRGRTGCVGILVPDLLDPVLAAYASRLAELLHEHDLQAIPLPTGWSVEGEARSLEALKRRQVDAMISLHYHSENAALYRKFRQQGYHLVFRVPDLPLETVEADCVGVDITDAYETLVQHLASQGYCRIGVVGGQMCSELAAGRDGHPGVRYWRKAHAEAGLSFDTRRAITCTGSAEDACIAVQKALSDHPGRFDALVVQSNKYLLGVWRAIRLAGLDIPRQMGLAVISDSEFARLLDVPVTVWDQPVEKICRGLIDLVRRKQNGETSFSRLQYASRLIVRQSTARSAAR